MRKRAWSDRALSLPNEEAYYGHLVLRLMGCFVLFYTSRVICKGRLTMEEIRARRSAAQQYRLTTHQEVNGPLVLTLPNRGQLSAHEGMRTRSEGTQASGEEE